VCDHNPFDTTRQCPESKVRGQSLPVSGGCSIAPSGEDDRSQDASPGAACRSDLDTRGQQAYGFWRTDTDRVEIGKSRLSDGPALGRNPVAVGRNHGDDPQPTRVSPSFLTSYKLTRSLQFPHSVLKAHEHAVTVSRLILQSYSPEIILGSADLTEILYHGQ